VPPSTTKPDNVLEFPYKAPDMPTPPVTTSVPVVWLLEAVFAVNVVEELAVRVVNAAVLGLEEPMLEFVIVLFANDSEPDSVAKVPVVGSVTFVDPVEVKVIEFAPEVTKFPPKVIVLDPLFTPVPP
jgi:hypothetical protein